MVRGHVTQWVLRQRAEHARSSLPERWAARLQDLPGWRWSGEKKASGSRRGDPAATPSAAADHRAVALACVAESALRKRGAEGAADSNAEKRRGPPGKKVRRSAEDRAGDDEVLVVTTGLSLVDARGGVVRSRSPR